VGEVQKIGLTAFTVRGEWMSKKKLAGIIVACVIAIGVVMFVVSTGVPTEPATPGTIPPTEELGAIKITASDLFDEYKVNEIAADYKYKNHIVTTVGKIVTISRDPQTGKAYASLSTGASHYSLGNEVIRCFFRDETELLNLALGEEIIVTGKCLGKKEEKEGTSFPILFENCSLVEQTEFEVVDCKITQRPTWWWGLEISFRKFGYSLDFFLINPEGMEIEGWAGIWAEQFYEYTCADTEGTAYFELPRTPPGGQYRLLVKDSKERVVATKTYNFSGASPKVEIVDYRFSSFNVEFPTLYVISFRIKNDGDLPINAGYLEVVDNGISCFYCLDPHVQLLPSEEGTFKADAHAVNYGLPFSCSGEQRVTLNFRDYGKEGVFRGAYASYEYGRVVYSINITVIVP